MKIIIVGAGLAGATAAAVLSENHNVEVFEIRNHIGGNCYDGLINNIMVQQYGGHIFHTSNDEVWEFVKRYAHFNNYRHKVIANTKKHLLYIPVSKSIMEQFKLTEKDIIDLVFKDYSEKQWGKKFADLPGHIKNRVPIVRENEGDTFFTDKWQGIPTGGYTNMIGNMLEGSTVHLRVSRDEWRKRKCDLIIHTGSIDQAYNYTHGMLGYRSLRFEHRQEKKRMSAVINECTHDVPHTRSYDNSHWQNQNVEQSIITYEYPCPQNETPYHPVGSPEERSRYHKYLAGNKGGILFMGRLGLYRYMNMDEVVADTLERIRGI